MDVAPASEVQLNLFTKFDHTKNEKLMSAVDNINTKWGSETLRSAVSGYKRVWSMKRATLSPRYATNWNEIIKVRAD